MSRKKIPVRNYHIQTWEHSEWCTRWSAETADEAIDQSAWLRNGGYHIWGRVVGFGETLYVVEHRPESKHSDGMSRGEPPIEDIEDFML